MIVRRRSFIALLAAVAGCSRVHPIVVAEPVFVETRLPTAAAVKDSVAPVVAPTAQIILAGSADTSASVQMQETRVDTVPVPVAATPIAAATPVVDTTPVSVAASWDIEVRTYENTDRVARYVKSFTGEAKDRIQIRLTRGTRYEPMIRQKLREGGLPEDMYFLALVESGFDPNAYSKAAAVGMWQFMTSTGRGMGLRIDWWIDERRDPVKSTDAAVRFIKGLNDQFGSLYLAAAAYNGGPGRIARGLTRYADAFEGMMGDDLFFALAEKNYLKGETRNYVPQIIAAALVAKEPAKYDFKIDTLPVFAYDSVMVGPGTPLAAVAIAAGVPTDTIRALNPHILRGMTPMKDSMMLRVPRGSAATFDSAFDALDDSARVGARSIKTKTGETMAAIAKREHLTTTQLGSFNPGAKRLKSGKLVAGQTLLVPTKSVALAVAPVPDPAIERYGGVIVGAKSYVVRSGDNISTIAKKHGVSSDALMKANSLRKPLIFPGQTLVIPRR